MHPTRLTALLLTLLLAVSACAGPADKRLDIYWVDVEGGAATLIVTPAGESILIDSGNPGDRDPQRIFDVTKVAGLTQIDHLVVTHFHVDHFGGASKLATLIPIRNVWDNGFDPQTVDRPERPTRAYAEFKTDLRHILNPNDELPLKSLDGSPAPHIRCIAARQKTIDAPQGAPQNPLCTDPIHKPRDLTDNANSIVQLLTFGDFRFFDGGDLSWNIELKLVCPINLVGSVDVYQTNHHGLDASNNPLLIQSLAPNVAVMNNGPKKGCDPNTVAALRGTASIQQIYQLHRNIRPDGKLNNVPDAAYIANEQENCDGNYVKLSVDPTAKTYTLTIPATKHERTYQVNEKK
jgi:beta-lactamase superfamily II metal-dependent hydrolase